MTHCGHAGFIWPGSFRSSPRKGPRLSPRPCLLAITRVIGSIAAIRYPIAADIDVAHLAAGVNPAVESQVGGLTGVTMLAAVISAEERLGEPIFRAVEGILKKGRPAEAGRPPV